MLETAAHVPSAVSLSSPRVGVVTVSYGSGPELERFLSSLAAAHDESFPVAVVDNKPGKDGVSKIAKRHGAHYLSLPDNPGYGAAMNAGVRTLRERAAHPCDAYFFCNPDVYFVESVIPTLTHALFHERGAGSVGPRTIDEHGQVYPSARHIPAIGTGVGHALLRRVWPHNPWSRAYWRSTEYEQRRSAGWLSGAAVMLRRESYEAIGGWDESYFLHFEDVDLGYRLGLAGYLNLFEPSATIVHAGGHALRAHPATAERAMTESAIRFMKKRYSGCLRAPIRWAVTAGLRIRGTLIMRTSRSYTQKARSPGT